MSKYLSPSSRPFLSNPSHFLFSLPNRCRTRCAVGWADAKTTARTRRTPARTDRCRSWWIAFHFIQRFSSIRPTPVLWIQRTTAVLAGEEERLPDRWNVSLHGLDAWTEVFLTNTCPLHQLCPFYFLWKPFHYSCFAFVPFRLRGCFSISCFVSKGVLSLFLYSSLQPTTVLLPQ
jgi:hypothetical protein